MKNLVIKHFVFILFAFMLCIFVGCNNDVENNDGTGYVTFTDETSSRSLHTGGESAVDPENLVWAYVAVKKDGLHTVGASEVATSATTGKTELVDGKDYVLKPVKEDFSKGLNVEVGPFSWGEWKFVLYAYEKCVSGVFTNLVYTASTLETFTTLNPLASGKTSVPVLLKFVNGSGYPSTGTLKLGDISLIVPQGMKFYSGKTVEVFFTDTTSSAIAAFTGSKTLSADAEAGTAIPLTFATTQFNNVAVGAHILEIEVKYDSTQITTAGAYTYTFLIKEGDVVTLYGDVTDLKTTSGSDTNTVFSTAVCRLGDVEYDSLVEALAATTSTNYTIHLLRNVDYGGVVTGFYGNLKVVIVMDGYYVKNLTIPNSLGSADGKMLGFAPNDALISTAYHPYGIYTTLCDDFDATIDFIYIQPEGTNFSTWVKCKNGYLNCSGLTAGNFYIYGRLNYLNIGARKDVANNLGAHIYCDVDGTAASGVGLYAGYFEFGDNIHISKLAYGAPCTAANSVVVGKPTTVIDSVPGKAGVIREVTLNGNGAKVIGSSATSVTLYAVQGTKVALPLIKDTFDRKGFIARYNTKADGTGNFVTEPNAASVQPPDTWKNFVVKDNVTLYVIWEMNCLCFTTKVANNTISMTKSGTAPTVNLEYSKDGGSTWVTFTPGSTGVPLTNIGDKVYFKATTTNNAMGNSAGRWIFAATQDFDASGSVMSLLDGNGSSTGLSTAYAFALLFQNCTHLKSCPQLPATTLSNYCYYKMFEGCTGLTDLWSMILPAENIPAYAYREMYYNCTNLVKAPQIAARKVTGNNALYGMFMRCSALTTIQDQIYIIKDAGSSGISDTFRGFLNNCTSLITPPSFYGVTVLGPRDFMHAFPFNGKMTSLRVGFSSWGSADGSGYTPCYEWVSGVDGVVTTGTFTCPAALPTTTRGKSNVPTGWTIVNGH